MNISEQKFRQLLNKYLQGTATEQEMKLLDRFFDSYASEATEVEPSDEKIGNEIRESIHTRLKSQRRISHTTHIWRWAAAISILVVVSAIFFYDRFAADEDLSGEVALSEQTKRGQKSVLQLPDGTTVHLNSKTTLEFPKSFNGEARDVTLEGEAFFDVVKDASKPFIVRTKHASIAVLGTSFNIEAREKKTTAVTLVEGKVRVSSADQQASLEPGQQAVVSLEANRITTQTVDPQQFIAWKDNVLFFNRTSLADAARKIEDWYDVDVTISSGEIQNCLITGSYKDESLDNVLKSFEFLLEGDITRSGNRVTITGTRCK
jgi:transmembrane sensor